MTYTDTDITASRFFAQVWALAEKGAKDAHLDKYMDEVKAVVIDKIRFCISMSEEKLDELQIIPGTEWAWEWAWHDKRIFEGDTCGDTYGGITMNGSF